MKVDKSIQISAAPEKVWPFLVEPEKVVMWFDSFKKCEYRGEKHSGIGTTYYVEEKVPDPLRKINFKASDWDENKHLTLKMESGKYVNSYKIQWSLKESPVGTDFHFVEDVGMPFGLVGKILGKLGQGTADKMVEGMLTKLKDLSEKS